jgi:hypothetical protein
MELITQASAILKQGAELMENPAISGAVTGLFGWLKGILGKKSAKEKLELIEQNKHNEGTIAGVEANLEFILEDNEDLQKQLAEKIKEVEELMKKEGIDNSVKTNTINVSNSTNTKIVQAVDTKGGDITIN